MTWGFANHSAVGEFTAAALASDVVHLVAMAVWLGGLAVLGGALLPTGGSAAMRTAVPAFSRSAEISVALLVITGLFQLWRQVRTLPALLKTSYGQLLLLKVSVVLLVLALGAVARTWVRRHYAAPGAGRQRKPVGPDPHQLYYFRRRVSLEAALGLAVLGMAAALVATQPAHLAYAARHDGRPAVVVDPPARPAPPTAPGTSTGPGMSGAIPFDAGSGPAAEGLLAFEMLPQQVGPATAHLSVLDPTGVPKAVSEVKVALRLPEKDLGPLTYGGPPYGPGRPPFGEPRAFASAMGLRFGTGRTPRAHSTEEALVHLRRFMTLARPSREADRWPN